MSYFPNQGQQTSALSQSIVPASDAAPFAVKNLTKQYRINCDTLPLVSDWTTTTAAGDFIYLDGNSAGASYWVISKSPFNTGTESVIDGLQEFQFPIEAVFGLHRSQAALAQEFALDFADTGATSAPIAEIAITAISQTTTTLTLTFASNPTGYTPGMSVGIYGCADSRFNYPSLVVASIVGTTMTLVGGPAGTITSLTATPGALGSPFLYARRRLGGSSDGTSMIFENATATNASFYARAGFGDAAPSGTASGNNSATISSSASSQAISTANAFSFFPSSDYRLNLSTEKVQWHSGLANSATATTTAFNQTVVCPDPSKSYKMRIRATNLKGLTVPVAKIVSVSKSGTTTATVTFAANHNLTVDDYILAYGVRDQTNFANLTTATKVSSVVSATQITIVWGSAVTATSYGGYVSRGQGNCAQAGAITQSIQTMFTTGGQYTVTGSAAWSGLSVGDLVDIYGCRDNATGADVGVDNGPYRVWQVTGTQLNLEQVPGGPSIVTVASTPAGGGIIKRTDLRVSSICVLDFERERVEFAPRPALDVSSALPVAIATPTTFTVSATNLSTNVAQVGGTAAAAGIASGSTNATLGVNIAAAVSSTDQSATAFAGSGRVNGTLVASARGGSAVVSAEINVSALTLGTATSVVFVLQESTGGTNFTDLWFSDPITATSIVRVPPIVVGGRRRWAAHSVGGTSTTVTATVTALELPPGSYPQIRQYRDAFAATNPLASVINSSTQTATSFGNLTATTQATSAMIVEGCRTLTAHMTLGGGPTVTTQPVVTLEVSQDLTNWISAGATMTAAGNGTYAATASNIVWRYARLRVTTAGVYSAGNYSVSSAGITAIS